MINTTILHLSLIEDIGPATINYLMSHDLVASLSVDVYAMTASDMQRYFNLTAARSQKIVAGLANKKMIDQELYLIDKYAVSWCTIQDPRYPTLLKNISAPPSVLYWQGADIAEDQKRMAVIGSRQANWYGQRAIEQIVPILVQQRWTIVSGGAIGADSMAHQATVDTQGKTIAVLGSGLLNPYPARNTRLFKTIIDTGGTLLSIFPIAMQGLPGNFPARNRVISGLSKGCVVVQAAKKSGASITAYYALEQGRDVFAVPGPIDDALSAGCHALIQQGAKLVSSAADIVQEYGELMPGASDKDQQLKLQESNKPALTGLDHVIVHACCIPQSVDELLDATGLPLSELNTHLFTLQLSGHIEQNFMGRWETKLKGLL